MPSTSFSKLTQALRLAATEARSLTPAGRRIGALLFASAIVLSACADNRKSVYIRGVVPAEASGAGGGCNIDATSDELLLGGVLDPGIAGGYTLDLSIANQMVARANAQTFTAETNRVNFQRAEVRIATANAVRLDRFSVLLTGSVPPASGTTPGIGVISLNVVQSELLEQLRDQGGDTDIVAFVKLFGETLGGREVETDFFQFPITVTAPGGLVSFPAPEDGVVDCQKQSASDQGSCRIGQNGLVPCARCFPNPFCTPS